MKVFFAGKDLSCKTKVNCTPTGFQDRVTKVNGLNLLKTRGTYFTDGNKVEAYGTALTYLAFCTPFIFITAGIKEDVEERYKLPR